MSNLARVCIDPVDVLWGKALLFLMMTASGTVT
jgi:hypothetical protein